jgi:hypothetical protein
MERHISRVEKAAVEQAGHTAATAAAHYGRSSLDEVHGSDPSDTLPLYRIASHVWQSELGLREEKSVIAGRRSTHQWPGRRLLPVARSLDFLGTKTSAADDV